MDARRHPYAHDDVDDFPDILDKEGLEHDDDTKHRRPQIPQIPEMRFENSYLRSLRGCLEIQHHDSGLAFPSDLTGPQHRRIGEGSEGYEKVEHSKHASSEAGTEAIVAVQDVDPRTVTVALQPTFTVVNVDWKSVAWITTKDQLIMPFLQGMLW